MPVNLHFICRNQSNWNQVGPTEFDSGNWKISKETAKEAVGCRIFLHERQNEVAWHGGRILSWREYPQESGRLIFTYKVEDGFGILLSDGWSQEKAIIRL